MSTQSVVIAITAKSQGVDEELKKTKGKFQNLNKSILGDKAQDAVKGMQKSLGGLSSVGDSLGGVFKNIIGGFTSMLTPIGLATAAIGGLITMGVNLYKKLTLSHEEYIDYLNYQQQNSQKRFGKIENKEKTDNGYFQRLKELNQVEKVSNAIKTETVMIIQLLTRRYGDLGLSIDETTGKILGLDSAFDQFQKKVSELKLKQLRVDANISKNKVNSQFSQISITGETADRAERFDTFLSPSERAWWFAGKGKAADNAKRRLAMWNTENGYQVSSDRIAEFQQLKAYQAVYTQKKKNGTLTEVDKEDAKAVLLKLENLKKIMELETKLKVVQEMISVSASDPSQNKKWRDLSVYMEQYITKLQKANAEQEKGTQGQIGRRNRLKALATLQQQTLVKTTDAERGESTAKSQTRQARQQYALSRMDQTQKIEFYDKKIAKTSGMEKEFQAASQDQLQGILTIKDKYGKQISELEEKERKRTITQDQKKTLAMYRSIFGNRLKAYQQSEKEYANFLDRFKTAQKKHEQKIGKSNDFWTDQEWMDFYDKNKGLYQQQEQRNLIQHVQNTNYQELKKQQSELQQKQLKGSLSAEEFDKLLEVNKQIIIVEATIATQKQMQANLTKDLTQLELKRKAILDEVNKQFKDANKELDRQLQLQQRILEGDLKAIERQKVLNALKAKGYDPENLKKQGIDVDKQVNTYVDKKMDLESKKYFTSQTKAIEKQIEMQKLILQGKFDQIERQKIINDLKAKGAKIDEKEVDALLAKKKALSALQFQGDIKSQAQSLYDNLNSQINRKQAEIEKRTRQAEEKYGTLTDEQKDKIVKVVGLEFQLEKLTNTKPNYNPRQIETNQLTRRGGFASGYVMFNQKDEVNKQIKTITEKQAALLKQIKDLISDGSRIP